MKFPLPSLIVVVLLLLAPLCSAMPEGVEPGTAALEAAEPATSPPEAAATNEPPGQFALLVGCTKYPTIKGADLLGPANDVELLRKLLVERYRFQADNCVTLTESNADSKLKPLRANIEREFQALTKKAKAGDQVFIFLAGHGSQQPNDNPLADPEPYGMDQVFLPADAVGDLKADRIKNAIIDDELQSWLAAITKTQAQVWIMVDACHSGTMIRGNERLRKIPMEKLISTEAIKKVDVPARPAEVAGSIEGPAEINNIVAIYASCPDEPTIEGPMPPDDPQGQTHGLLTYAVVKVLSEAQSPLSYCELGQRIQMLYQGWGRIFPTPLVEGGARHHLVLGTKAVSRLQIRIAPEGLTGWKVSAGAVHGLTPNSILAVYPPAGESPDKTPIGYVKVLAVRPLDASVEPCEYKELPIEEDFALGSRCELEFLDYSLHRIRIAPAGNDADFATQTLKTLAARKESPIEFTASPEKAEWILSLDQARTAGQCVAWLYPSSGWSNHQEDLPASLLRTTLDAEGLGDWVHESANKIHHAQGLLKLAEHSADALAPRSLGVKLRMLRFRDENDRIGQLVDWDKVGIEVRVGDIVGFEIENESKNTEVDVTLLFIDSGMGIKTLFPPENAFLSNRLEPGKLARTGRFKVDNKTIDWEHLVAIAVRAQGQPVDFADLQQPGIPQVRGEHSADTRGKTRGWNSPLEQLLLRALYSTGTRSGMESDAHADHVITSLTWRVLNATEKP